MCPGAGLCYASHVFAAAQPDDLVILTKCYDNIEASVLRSMLESSEIACLVQGETHRAMLGFMGPYIELHVLVPRADLDDAQQILAELRAHQAAASEPDEEDGEPEPAVRKRLGLAILVALGVTFGCGHFYAGARRRGFALAAVECGSFYLMFGRGPLQDALRSIDPGAWFAVIGLTILYDLVGSIWIIGHPGQATLPR